MKTAKAVKKIIDNILTHTVSSSNYITNDSLASTLNNYGTRTYINNNFPSFIYANNNFVKKNELLNYVTKEKIDSVYDAFTNIELSPSSPMIPVEDFEFDDSHVLSSLAVKTLIDNSLKNFNTFNPDIERRLAILEAKCKNIVIDEDVNVQDKTQALTVEERLAILERKCVNMKI